MPNLKYLMQDEEECSITMDNEDLIRDITILMTADQDVQFKCKTLVIYSLKDETLHILEWLLLKSPNLIFLLYKTSNLDDNFNRGLEIKKELKFK
jgi:hypothetical protein